MHFSKSKAVLVCALLLSLGVLLASTPGIGVAMSEGNILINNSSSAGNATVFNGSTLETLSDASQVRLSGGAQLRLASDSRGTVFTDHVDLQKGSARFTGYSANASGLNVRADGNASANVSIRDQGVIQVAALTGSVHVFKDGFNVANLLPGRALDLRPQDAGASAPSSLVGCAVKSGNNMLLTDETSNVTVQLKGSGVKIGRHVQITGSMVPNATPASGATQVINVTSVKQVQGPCKSTGAVAGAAVGAGAAAAGGAAAGGAAGAGVGAATIAAVGVGVAAAAGVGAAVASGAIGGSSTPAAPVSSGRLGAFN